MRRQNKIFTVCGLLLAVSVLLFGCRKSQNQESFSESQNQKVKVVATIFPLYDWAKNIISGSENVELELLVKNGSDLHSFQPSTQDIVKISTADVLIYVGGESDSWLVGALKNSVNKNQSVINLMKELSESVKEEKIVEGMSESEKKAEKMLELENFAENQKSGLEYDEHIWLSVENAKSAVEKIAEVLEEKDAGEKSLFEVNKKSYLEKLGEMEIVIDYEKSESTEKRQTIVVCDRFPFRYMTDELGVKYYAAFAGCSAESEASFETIAFLSRKIRELDCGEVFVTESSDKKIAETVIKNAGLEGKCGISVLDSMQSATLDEAEKGKNYIDVMKENFRKLGFANEFAK